MSLRLESVVPWGRSLEEYEAMFSLSGDDLAGGVLDCGGGPASFNAELSARGCRVVSCDPLYAFGAEEIAERVRETYPVILGGVEAERERFVWDRVGSPARLGEIRLAAMRAFLADFEAGRAEGRYVAAGLPALPFEDDAWGLALCSHLLFLYAEQLDAALHVASIREMLRVAREARIFPLLDMAGEESAHLRPVAEALRRAGYGVEVERVPYEFQRGGDRMLRVRRG